MVRTDLVVDVENSVDQEVEENVPGCGLIGGDVLNQGWIEGAVVPGGSVLTSRRLRAIL